MKNVTLSLLFCCMPMVAVTPAEMSIQKAEAQIVKHPGNASAHNDLAMALARRARETSDVQFYAQAEAELETSLRLEPDNLGGMKTRTWLLLGRHEFAKARDLATKLNKQRPDDLTVYGYLADANAELGNYKEAVDAVQWMLNLRPGNVPGLTRAAYLRELHGDFDGAIDLMQQACESTPFTELEDRAWLLTQISHLQLASGNQAEAERFATGALELFPNYHYALGMLGQLRMTQHRYDDAAALFAKRVVSAPHAENLFVLGEALQHAGKKAEADRVFADFEDKALVESATTDNANHELVSYYIDYAGKPDKALQIATQELARRHDAYTLDAHAWALYATGEHARAAEEIRQALAFGLRDHRVVEHARIIQARASSGE